MATGNWSKGKQGFQKAVPHPVAPPTAAPAKREKLPDPASDPARWLQEPADEFDFPRGYISSNDIKHLDGIPWHEAPLPPRFHRCKPQTKGWVGFSQVNRCACGAIKDVGTQRGWCEKNSRRKA